MSFANYIYFFAIQSKVPQMFLTSTLLVAMAPMLLLMVVNPPGEKKKPAKKGSKAKATGPKTGTKYHKPKTNMEWYQACEKYLKLTSKISQRKFLQSELSGPNFTGTESEVVSFNKKLKRFKEGELKPNEMMRTVASKFPNVEKKLIGYLDLRSKLYQQDKCGCSWLMMQEKALLFASQENIPESDFKASPHWIQSTLRRHNYTSVKLHGEASDMDPEKRKTIMDKWRKEVFHPAIEEHEVKMCCIYNADQTGLFYQKMPNRLYVEASKKKSYAGTKQMKDKTRVTLMVCTAADGTKVPLAMIGKSKTPVCFTLCENGKPPMAYMNQQNAWFDQNITLWWINKVFCKHHEQKHGSEPCILLLDNCSAHKIDFSTLPDWLHVIFLPPNMTSNHQPADMGMIACLKVGYRAIMLRKLLEIFDVEGGYDGAAAARKTMRKGCRGLEYGAKATILDAMKILDGMWKVDGKYARESGIQRCWRKAEILPIAMETKINAEVGTLSIPNSQKTLSKEDNDELCSLMANLHVKVNENEIDCVKVAVALQGSFVADIDPYSEEDYSAMAEMWVDIEDDPDIVDAVCEDEILELESSEKPPADDGAGDDDEPEAVPEDIDAKDILTFGEATEAIRKLKISGASLGVPPACTVLLDRFERAVRAAAVQKPKKNPTLHSFFHAKKKK